MLIVICTDRDERALACLNELHRSVATSRHIREFSEWVDGKAIGTVSRINTVPEGQPMRLMDTKAVKLRVLFKGSSEPWVTFLAKRNPRAFEQAVCYVTSADVPSYGFNLKGEPVDGFPLVYRISHNVTNEVLKRAVHQLITSFILRTDWFMIDRRASAWGRDLEEITREYCIPEFRAAGQGGASERT